MIEHVIHLPLYNNDETVGLSGPNNAAIEEICKHFGGATVSEVRGIWFDDNGVRYDEHCLRVIAAGEATAENANFLRRLAFDYAGKAQQLAMYVVTMSGAEIIDTTAAIMPAKEAA